MEAEVKPLEDEQLANGVVVRFYDVSRRVAGDRWQVTVRYDATVSVSESFWSRVSGEPELVAEIRAALGPEVVLSGSTERNFVAQEEKEKLVNEIVGRIRENMFGYLADPDFPERYFQRCFEEAREEIVRKTSMSGTPVDEPGDEDDEPADFSHLFRDK